MKIVIKELKGGEQTIEVKDGSVTAREVKNSYESLKNVKIAQSDKLLFRGKPLKDDETLDSYGVKDGDKLHLVIMGGAKDGGGTGPRPFWELLRNFLKKHFSEADTTKIIDVMKMELRHWIYSTSLEMIEETAVRNLEIAKSKK